MLLTMLCIHKNRTGTGCSKAPKGLLFPTGRGRLFAALKVQKIDPWDSVPLVGPFMHVYN